MTTILVSVLLPSNLEWVSILRLMLQTPIADHHSSRDKALDGENGSQLLAVLVQEMMTLSLEEFMNVATDTSAETRKLEDKLDALVNFVTQLTANQKSASVAKVCGIRSSNDHHTSVCPSSQQSGVGEHPEAYALAANQKPASVARVCGIRSSNDHHTSVCLSSQQSGVDTSAETRKLEGKLDALVNLVTQLAANRSLPLLQESAASVLPMTTILVCVLLRCNLEWMSILRLMLQTYSARKDAIVIIGVHDVATYTSAETRKLEGKLDALVNLVTQLAGIQKPASVARVWGIRSSNDHHTRVHDVATDTSVETRKLEGKLDALVNLVTQLAANQKLASVARVCNIRYSNDHHTSVYPSSQQSGVDEHPEAYAANTIADNHSSRDKLEGKLDALVNLVTQLAAIQKPASVARVCGIRSSNDHHTSVCPSSQQSGVDEHPEAYAANTIAYHHSSRDKALDREDGSQLLALEGKLDALVNLVTKLAANQNLPLLQDNLECMSILRLMLQKSIANHHNTRDKALDREDGSQLLAIQTANRVLPLVARVCDIRSSNDHHTSVYPSSQQSGVVSIPRLMLQTPIARPPQSSRDKALDREDGSQLLANTSAETRKLEGKLDALVNLVTQLAANQKPASVAKVCGIRSSNDHHTSVCPSSQQSGRRWLPTPSIQSARNDAIVIRGVHDVATYTSSAETRKLEGKLDALVNLVTQLAANQKPASVARVCGIRSSNDHHTSVCPSSQQSGVDEHPEAYAANTYSRPPQQERQGT
ncbi:hypothetical protein Fmac_028554 [Flemingia macrophylla]|uniref:Uncharacterized protein n=1 Tax=Flemingia macrophylla TaxID=520843 RepID=A0ABD1L7U3_9FABA